MDKMRMATPDFTDANIEKLAELFPSVVTETRSDDGKSIRKAVNFDMLRQLLSKDLVEGDEAYEFTWVGKKESILEAGRAIRKTLRPCKEESKNWDTTENLYIEGDNLDVLKLLQESYLGKIKMIYIDPPYNTGNDFVYKDNFAKSKDEYDEDAGVYDEDGDKLFKNTESNGRFHSDWCSMMYPRLMLARNLLSDDGVIFISIDYNENYNLRSLCNEIFGVDNLLSELIWDLGTGTTAGHFATSHQYILTFAKNKQCLKNFEAITDDSIKHGALKKISRVNPASEVTFPVGFEYEGDSNIFYGELGGSEKEYILSEKMEFQNGKLIEPVTIKAGFAMRNQLLSWIDGKETFDSKGQKIIKFYFNRQGILFYEKERGAYNPKTVISDLCNSKNGTEETKEILQGNYFDYPKPLQLIKFISILGSNKDCLILDFFSGSSTTAHAVMQLNAEDGGNRKFIMVQLPETCAPDSDAAKAGYKTICDIGKERIRRAGEKIKAEQEAKIAAAQATKNEKSLVDKSSDKFATPPPPYRARHWLSRVEG